MHAASAASASAASAPRKRKAASSSRNATSIAAAGLGHKPRSTAGMMGMPNDSCSSDDEEEEEASVADGALRVGPRIRVGNRDLRQGSQLVEMRDSTAEFKAGRFDLLRQRLEADGFLFVRGVIPPPTVQKARARMLSHLASKGAIREGTEEKDAFIEYSAVFEEKKKGKGKGKAASAAAAAAAASASVSSRKMIPGWTIDAETGGIIGGREPDSAVSGWFDVGNSKELTDVYNGPGLRSFYQQLFAQDEEYRSRPALVKAAKPSFSTLPSCTWLRAKGPGEVTAEHADYYYFYKNTHIFRDFWRIPDQPEAKSAAPMSDEERETCQLCHDAKDPAATLICDLCQRGFHTYCLRPALKASELPSDEQEWHCYDCCNLSLPYWTCWTALGNISGHDGRLALIPGSHKLGGYESASREDLLPRDFTKKFELDSVWQTPTRIDAGDIILFNIKLIHAATRNAGEKFRLSLDTRVTTAKGQQYLEDNEMEELGAKESVEVQVKAKQGGADAHAEARSGATVAAFFTQQKKKQKIEA